MAGHSGGGTSLIYKPSLAVDHTFNISATQDASYPLVAEILGKVYVSSLFLRVVAAGSNVNQNNSPTVILKTAGEEIFSYVGVTSSVAINNHVLVDSDLPFVGAPGVVVDGLQVHAGYGGSGWLSVELIVKGILL